MPEELRIARLELECPADALRDLEDCYGGRLGLPCDGSGAGLCVRVGAADLAFAPAAGGRRPFHHFALLVPGDRFDAAHEWLAGRERLLAGDDGGTVFAFEFWDARACYFHDPAGNIVELIAHRGVAERPGAAGPFSASELAGVSEAGVVAPDPVAAARTLERLGLERWSGGGDDLVFVGRRAHTLVIARPGRGWLPTGRPAEPHAVAVTLTGGSGAVDLPGTPARVRLEPPGAARVVRLDHLVLTVADLEATVAFYERLGMRREEFGDGRVALRFGASKINLHRAGAEFQPHARRPTPGSADLCLLIEGTVAEAQRRLGESGIPIELGPVERIGAQAPLRSLYVRDPDGNLVELSEPV